MTPALLLCLVIGIADGDSLTARCETPTGGENVKVRLAQIDAPERGQAFGTRSKQSLAALCLEQQAIVAPLTRDRYGWTVALVECRGQDASTEQVKAGMAWAYTRYLKDESLKGLESEAKAARRGLWADEAPIAPWEWRKQRG
jgi:endonuclease YncB( thermonuclease family)